MSLHLSGVGRAFVSGFWGEGWKVMIRWRNIKQKGKIAFSIFLNKKTRKQGINMDKKLPT